MPAPASEIAATRTVAEAMILAPRTSGREETVRDVKAQFQNDKIHAVLIVENGVLLAVVERSDLVLALSDDASALSVGRLSGRIVAGHRPLEAVHRWMMWSGKRRLAVVDLRGTLVGLLCLKSRGNGFCSAADLKARADERRTGSS